MFFKQVCSVHLKNENEHFKIKKIISFAKISCVQCMCKHIQVILKHVYRLIQIYFIKTAAVKKRKQRSSSKTNSILLLFTGI